VGVQWNHRKRVGSLAFCSVVIISNRRKSFLRSRVEASSFVVFQRKNHPTLNRFSFQVLRLHNLLIFQRMWAVQRAWSIRKQENCLHQWKVNLHWLYQQLILDLVSSMRNTGAFSNDEILSGIRIESKQVEICLLFLLNFEHWKIRSTRNHLNFTQDMSMTVKFPCAAPLILLT
jgi:hypothetical protein